ncbi:MAG: MBL fold hydrolase [Rhodospirillales bacterium 69-11]|nr:N-acyl homoserine lactonase family protein [Rhodospirillales bacterium]OJW31260.1 MAG: MBL fold hydrolase [Rhodospirillales bacterium 69-11]
MSDVYELYALRYATRQANRAEHFIGGDPHDGPMPMDYFVWVAKNAERAVVIDIGFTAESGGKRGRTLARDPIDSLALLGVDVARVEDVILTHMHYDHVGNFGKFPIARFHLQEPEMHYATGRYMKHKQLARSFEPDDVCGVVRLNFDGRVVYYDGPAEVAPGITVHPTGGHSAGLQFVCVETARGRVVLASDVTHFYENMETGRPFTTALHIGDMLEAFDTLRAHAPTPQHIVPGHDPLVMRRYPAPSPALEGIAVRLDVAPTA